MLVLGIYLEAKLGRRRLNGVEKGNERERMSGKRRNRCLIKERKICKVLER